MVVVRRFDNEATALQRQGQLGLWPPSLGQEAAQVGSARALRKDDFVFTSYREHGVAYVRGVRLEDMTKVWRGTANSGWDPFTVGMATPAVIIGAQTLHATGYAMGVKKDGADSVAVAYFGDGATSQGDVNEAMIFAASFKAPVIFFCQNNHWAISEPVGVQAVRADRGSRARDSASRASESTATTCSRSWPRCGSRSSVPAAVAEPLSSRPSPTAWDRTPPPTTRRATRTSASTRSGQPKTRSSASRPTSTGLGLLTDEAARVRQGGGG